ncbi:small conductance mechanosensitive channel [Salsuginibacillus halophilus]|uniref:Small conductance mechanosensitive channel n=1 Tax=Salsuginibacillus halophilus TaxID=517424 RepID=A0A2P8HXB9_9BACI|nr:mechanosensitive ion channel family protein [Salsuginibacillus halophilus]PSL50862.1 small conductance mechanosensitive channel [Salsuginibacillus halophilus]
MPEFLQEGLLADFVGGAFIIILQILLVLIGFFVAKAIGQKLIARTFKRMQEQKNVHPSRTKTLEKLIVNMFNYVLIFIFIVVVLGIFEISIAPFIASAGIIGLAVGFGAQGLVSDIVTGFFILLEKQIEVDDYVTVSGLGGIVEEVGLRTTQVRGFDGTLHYIPNREIGSVSNHSRGNMRAMVDIGISYDHDPAEAIRVLQDVCDQVAAEEEAIQEGPDVVGVQSLGDSEVTIRIIGHTENMEQWGIERKIRERAKKALEENNIEIPYPHQVYVHKEQTA